MNVFINSKGTKKILEIARYIGRILSRPLPAPLLHLSTTRPLHRYTAIMLCCAIAPLSAAPKQVVVGPEDTVYGIAYEHGIPTRTLISANNLTPPYALVRGQVLTIPGTNEHIVGSNETLQSIAEDHGVRLDVLAQENSISSPYFVHQGQVLIVPPHDTESMAEALTAPAAEIKTASLAPLPLVKVAPDKAKGPVSGTANPSIDAERDADGPISLRPLAAAPAAAKALPDDLAAELAQEKGVPGPSSDKPVLMGNLAKGNEGAPTGSLALTDEEKIEKKPKEKKTIKKEEKKVVKTEEKEKKIEEEKIEKEKVEPKPKKVAFVWPVQGEIISNFGGEPKNDGINIQASENTPVIAVADGEVMYSGDELKDFGNLLLVKHDNGHVTAYAHLGERLVQKGDKVKQGKTIGKVGKTGGVKEPQLHFEIRKGKQPVDPAKFLP
jgi:murein DD-endopeptidase MepM/ murein hydrolase activator NlpD